MANERTNKTYYQDEEGDLHEPEIVPQEGEDPDDPESEPEKPAEEEI